MFIDEHRRGLRGRADLQDVLPIAPSTYRAHARRIADPSRLSDRAKRDAACGPRSSASNDKLQVYGVRKVWRQLNREGIAVARWG